MSEMNKTTRVDIDEAAGLRAPPSLDRIGKILWWMRFIFIVQLARLRFFAILGVIGFLIVKWDDLNARYEKWTRSAGVAEAASSDTEYFCPMHPTVIRANNKEKCPICFMPLSKRKKGDVSDESLPAGVVSRVQLSPYRIVLAGVRTAPVAFQTLVKEITTVGTVEFDERGLLNVSSRVKGRIEKLFVNQTGQLVNKGDPLAAIYSPDLVITVQNLLDAKQANNAGLQRDARERLKTWGIDDKQLDDIVLTGKPISQLTIRSPIAGHVIKKYARQGQYVEEGGTLYDVADISTVWVQAQMYEDDLAFLPTGSHDPLTGNVGRKLEVVATARAFPGRQFAGTLSFLFPHLDTETRALTVRFELANKDHELRPGMSATVTLRLTLANLADLPASRRLQVEDGKILAIPESSVIDTGKEKVVYREELPGTFEGVSVELGSRMSGPNGEVFFPVLAGLKPSDLVVVAGSFLIDAETRLNPAMGSIYIGGNGSKSGPATASNVRPSTPEDKDAKIKIALSKLSPADRALAEAQKFCPILEGTILGEMDVPVKVDLDGQSIFLCCKNCIKQAKENPSRAIARVADLKRKGKQPEMTPPKPDKEAAIRENLAKLTPEDRKRAEAQRLCPITKGRLGSMGVPTKLTIGGRVIFTCCESCDADVKEDPDSAFKKIDEYRSKALEK